MKSKRRRFNLNCCASSRGAYVMKAHKEHLKENHDKHFADAELDTPVTHHVIRKYYVTCWKHEMEITEQEALNLGLSSGLVIIKEY